MSTRKQRSASKERFWRRMVRRCRGSGLTVRAFCAEHGVSEPNFYAWRRTLAERDSAGVKFVPVRVTGKSAGAKVPESMGEGAAGAGATGTLELVLDGGRRVRVGPGFDGPTLRRLLALLENVNGHDQGEAETRVEGRP
jgi:transposase-like protein